MHKYIQPRANIRCTMFSRMKMKCPYNDYSGGFDGSLLDDILEFDPQIRQWKTTGRRMIQGRYFQAVSVVYFDSMLCI